MDYFLTSPSTRLPSPTEAICPLRQVQQSGHRFYKPDIGRWVNRDPIGDIYAATFRGSRPEQRHMSMAALYLFCHNRPVLTVDYLGLLTVDGDCGCWSKRAIEAYLTSGTARTRWFDSVVNGIREPFKTAVKTHFDSMTFMCVSDSQCTGCANNRGHTPVVGVYSDISYTYRSTSGLTVPISLTKQWKSFAYLCADTLKKYDIAQWFRTAVHETAHNIGWGGHYDDSTDSSFDNMEPSLETEHNQSGWGIP